MRWIFTPLSILLSVWAMAAAPTVPSTNLSFNAIDGGYFNLGWTAGNGARRLIVCKAGSAPGFVPQNGVDYTENTIFGLGQQVAPGEFIVYDHFSTSFFLTGLNPATQYFFRIYDYNGSGATTEYLTASFLAGSATTSATPTSQTSNAAFPTITTNSVTVTWTNGNGLRRLIVVRQGSPVNADPVSGTQYNVSFNFGNGATTGPGNYTVYNSTGTSTTISNLAAGTQYFLAFYEFNGNSQPQYLTPAYTTSVTTRSVPTIPSSNLTITKTDGKALTLNWTSGNGQRRIVVAKKGSNISSTPVNGTDYAANVVFGAGQQLGAGEFVVYDDNFNATTVTGLDTSSVYYFKIFEYDGTGSNTSYLTSSFASVDGPTASTPFVPAQPLAASNITSTSLRVNVSPGSGRARLIIARQGSPVNVTPAQLTPYTASNTFGNGQDLGNGNFAVASGIESSVTVHNLQPSATYHFAVSEYNGFDQPLYLVPGVTTSATTLGVLPVKLQRWEVLLQQDKAQLHWTTSLEENASHFLVERSHDGTQFTVMTTVQASNQQNGAAYSWTDLQPVTGKAYYRLKMVDQDGSFEYSDTRMVSRNSASIRIRQNPVQDVLQVVNEGQVSSWQVLNAAGQELGKGSLQVGVNTIAVAFMPAGSYWLRVIDGARIQTMGFIKL